MRQANFCATVTQAIGEAGIIRLKEAARLASEAAVILREIGVTDLQVGDWTLAPTQPPA